LYEYLTAFQSDGASPSY